MKNQTKPGNGNCSCGPDKVLQANQPPQNRNRKGGGCGCGGTRPK